MTIDRSDISLSVFFVGVTIIAVCWMNTKACSTFVTSTQVECSQACGSAGMLEQDRDGNCRCRSVSDAGLTE
jgi:hypothetical protein